MTKKLTILFCPLDGYGHVNACTGVAEALRDRGHRIVFAISQSWKGKLLKYGFEEELIIEPNRETDEKPGEFWINYLIKAHKILPLPPFEKMRAFGTESTVLMLEQALNNDLTVEQIVKRINPDVIVVDSYVSTPSILKSGIPWVWLLSANPLIGIRDDRTPPPYSGFSANDKKDWEQYRSALMEVEGKVWYNFNETMINNGLPALNPLQYIHWSPFLNIYAFPEELDYTDLRPIPEKWYRFDTFMRKSEEDFEIPTQLQSRDGKLIYLSMGSMGSADLVLMNRLVSILSKSRHKFIVSKGALHLKYELASNMWGQEIVPQTRVLPVVDLVITHGGNNTVTESLFFGKPMIVLPLFGDQPNNAQRVDEKGFGLRLDPYHCCESDLINGIERLLNDKVLAQKLDLMSKQIQSSNSTSKASELIESLVK